MEETEKPRMFSKEWWGNIFTALKPWKYGPKEVAIWNVSSWVTMLQLAVGAKLLGLIPASVKMFFASVLSVAEAMAAKAVAGVAIVFKTAVEFIDIVIN